MPQIYQDNALTLIVPISGAQNDFLPNPTNEFEFLTDDVWVLLLSGAVTLSGMRGGIDGRAVTLFNNSAFNLSILQESALSQKVNRFNFTTVVAAGAQIVVTWIAALERWTLTASPSASSAAVNFTLIGSDVAAGVVASLSVGSIPAAPYSNLKIVLNARSDNGANPTNVFMRFNSDAGANYDYEDVQAYSTGNVFAQTIGGNGALIGQVPAVGAPANRCGTSIAEVAGYAGLSFDKQGINHNGVTIGVGAFNVGESIQSFCWRPAVPVAIDTVTVVPAAGNFEPGSSLRVYGY